MKRILFGLFILTNMLRFRCAGIKYGAHLRIYNWLYLKIDKSAKVIIGNSLRYTSGGGINALGRNMRGQICVGKNATLKIGNNVGISSACIWVKEKVTIGNNVLVGGDSVIIDTDAHNIEWEKRLDSGNDYATAKSRPIAIEDNVMIGTRCIILKGVTIGARSVIGAGSVVTSDIPSDCIAVGNPCRPLRRLC